MARSMRHALLTPEHIDIRLLGLMLNDVFNVAVSIKDTTLRYVVANEAMLQLCGTQSREDLIGKTAKDFFSGDLAHRYESDDHFVLRTGRPLHRKLALASAHGVSPIWVVHGRYPVFDRDNELCGVAVTTRIPPAADYRNAVYARVAKIASYLAQNYAAPFEAEALAGLAGVSSSQLRRDFMHTLGISPRSYLLQLRIENALDLLLTEMPVAKIAQACGFGDHSAFANRFATEVGLSPSAYRRGARDARLSPR